VCALEARSYEDAVRNDAVRNAISIGGDSDTVAAIAWGVAEALFGLPEQIAIKGWGYLPEDMRAVVESMYARYPIRIG
jgi:ADP-ribosyl-[dinitrogen reductase] hydrolase